MEVNCNQHDPTERTPAPTEQKLRWAPEPVWTLQRRENLLLLHRLEILGSPLRSLAATPTVLFRLSQCWCKVAELCGMQTFTKPFLPWVRNLANQNCIHKPVTQTQLINALCWLWALSKESAGSTSVKNIVVFLQISSSIMPSFFQNGKV